MAQRQKKHRKPEELPAAPDYSATYPEVPERLQPHRPAADYFRALCRRFTPDQLSGPGTEHIIDEISEAAWLSMLIGVEEEYLAEHGSTITNRFGEEQPSPRLWVISNRRNQLNTILRRLGLTQFDKARHAEVKKAATRAAAAASVPPTEIDAPEEESAEVRAERAAIRRRKLLARPSSAGRAH